MYGSILLLLPEEFLRYVSVDDLHPFQLLEPLCCVFLLVVSSEVLNILGMREILLFRIIPMVFLEMMNLILILHVTVMARTEAKVR